MKTRFNWYVLPVILLLLLASCSPPVPAPNTTTPSLSIVTDTPPSLPAFTETPQSPPIGPTPVLSGPAIEHIPEGQVVNIMQIHMLDPNKGWGIGGLSQAQDHVFRTEDGGETWRDVTPPQPNPASGDTASAIGYFIDALTAWVAYGTGMAPPPPYIFLWITHDGGATWQYSSIDTSISSNEFFTPWFIDFSDALHGWLLIYLGAGMSHNYVSLLGTTDGGLTWNTLATPMDNNDIQGCPKTAMVFFDAQNGWLARECKGLYPAPHIMHTTDGGATWTRIEPPAPASDPNLFTDYACDMASPNPFSDSLVIMAMKCLSMSDYTTEKNYVYSTSDGGVTWISYPLPADYSMGEGLYFFGPLNGFALGRKIYRTTDGGQTWTFVQQVFWDGQFSFISGDHGWASVINDSNLNAFVETSDGGFHWNMLNPKVGP